MCIVSQVTTDRTYPLRPRPWTDPYDDFGDQVKRILNYQAKSRFSEWSIQQCEAYIELLEKAQKFDEIAGEPHCSDSEKTDKLNDLRDRLSEIGLEHTGLAQKCLALIVRLDNIIEKL